MTTALKLGPKDHGRPMQLDEFDACDQEGGFKYQLIRGAVHVAPWPNPAADYLEGWLLDQLMDYSRTHSEVINQVTRKARVHAPEQEVSYPEPDITAYHDFPRHRWATVRWQDVTPVLVVEILSADDPDKDLVRNVEVYLAVPSIREYWVLDPRDNPEQPSLRVHRRHGRRWRVIEVPFGGTYTTKLLPEFALRLDPNGGEDR